MTRIWILGASDPEMERIEALLIEAGEHVAYALVDGDRAHAGNAYRAAHIGRFDEHAGGAPDMWYLVECDVPTEGTVRRIDHHRPRDPGYGRPPAEFLPASSIGQVISELARLGRLPRPDRTPVPAAADVPLGTVALMLTSWYVCEAREHGRQWRHVPRDIVFAAAADQCLAAAYRGECPGVAADDLMIWRVMTRAAFQGRDPDAILDDIESTRQALRAAPRVNLRDPAHAAHTHDHDWTSSVCDGCAYDPVHVADMRRAQPWPELPEAAAREGAAYISGPLATTDGRRKYTCAGPPEVVRTFLEANPLDLDDLYGDPERGFAGGYLTSEST